MKNLTTNSMKKIIANVINTIILASSINLPSYALKEYQHIKKDTNNGKYGYSILSESPNNKPNHIFDKNNWIRSRQKKIPCGKPNVVGIQSTSSALIIASVPQPIPDYSKCPIIKLT